MSETKKAVRVFGWNETLSYMRGVAKFTFRERQTFGISTPPAEFSINPYVRDEIYSPVGLVLMWMGVEVHKIEERSARHMKWCEDPDCFTCSLEGGMADTSIFAPWVQKFLAEEGEIAFTDDALELLWSAETSGLPLWLWLEQGNPKDEIEQEETVPF